jgi:hypothetical protein
VEFWSAFLPQLLATIVGAGIGVIGVVLAFRLERRAATTDGFELSVERLLQRIDELAADTDAWQKTSSMTNWARGDRPPPHPHVGRVSIAIEMVKLRAAGDDVQSIQQISDAWDVITQSRGEQLAQGCGVLATAVVKWRAQAPAADFHNALRVARAAASASPEPPQAADT